MPLLDFLPDIIITHEDLPVLSRIVEDAMEEGRYEAASRLGNELHRAQVMPAATAPRDCLTLNVVGQYLEERSGAVREAILVAGEGRPSAGTVSVLSRMGTALLGLSTGQRIGWADPQGRPRMLQLLGVRQLQPASS